jgi:hypothetical protein
VIDDAAVRDWLAGYELAWRSPGTERLAELFAPGATYSTAPYEPPSEGLAAIARLWEAERDGPGEVFAMTAEVVAVDQARATAVARIAVDYGDPVRQSYRDLWVVRFGPDGRCTAFEEWPFWPPGSRGGIAGAGD